MKHKFIFVSCKLSHFFVNIIKYFIFAHTTKSEIVPNSKMSDYDQEYMDFIINLRDEKGQTEYLVKYKGSSYKKSEWIKDKDLRSTQEGKHLISEFRKQNIWKFDQDHYYDPEFDVIDKILEKNEDSYLVKWNNLPFSESTYETEVSDLDIEKFEKFQNPELFAKMKQKLERHSNEINTLKEYSFCEKQLSSTQIICLNSLITSFNNSQNLTINVQKDIFNASVFGAFCELLVTKEDYKGPFLILCDNDSLLDCYNDIHNSMLIQTFCYSGTDEDLEITEKYLFTDKKDKLLFHVLITTPQFVNEWIKGINWTTTFCFGVSEESGIKTNCTFTASFEQSSNYFNDTHDLLSTLVNSEMDEKEREIISSVEKQFQLFYPSHQQNLLNAYEYPEFYVIDCPLNEIQKNAVRAKLVDSVDAIKKGEFDILRAYLEKICHHPYLVPGLEILFKDKLEEASTKMSILIKLIASCHEKQRKIAIVSQYSKMLDLIEDYCETKGIACSRDKKGVFVTLLYTKNYTFVEEVKASDTVVFVDCQPFIMQGKKDVIQLLCNDVGENDWGSIDNELLCKYITIKAFQTYNVKDADELINSPLKAPKILSKLLIQIAEESTEFWNDYLDLSPVEPSEVPDTSERQFTIRERNQFIRGLFSFGLNKWPQIRNNIALEINDDELKVEADKVLRMTYQNSSSEGKRYIIDDLLMKEQKEAKRIVASQELINNLSENSEVYLENVELMEFLNACTQGDKSIETIKKLINVSESEQKQENGQPTSSKKYHETWWNESYDQALLLAYSKLGINSLDDFITDKEEKIRQIFKLTTNIEGLDQQGRKLLKKVRENCSTEDCVCGFFISQQIREKWQKNEIREVVNYILSFGIPLNKEGTEEYSRILEALPMKDHTEADIIELIEDILKNCNMKSRQEEFEKAAETFIQRIETMKDLHFILDQREKETAIRYINRAAKWKNMPKLFKPDVEYRFFQLLLENGFENVKLVIADQDIAQSFGKTPPGQIQKFSAIANRIHYLAESIRIDPVLKEPRPSSRKKSAESSTSNDSKQSPTPKANAKVKVPKREKKKHEKAPKEEKEEEHKSTENEEEHNEVHTNETNEEEHTEDHTNEENEEEHKNEEENKEEHKDEEENEEEHKDEEKEEEHSEEKEEDHKNEEEKEEEHSEEKEETQDTDDKEQKQSGEENKKESNDKDDDDEDDSSVETLSSESDSDDFKVSRPKSKSRAKQPSKAKAKAKTETTNSKSHEKTQAKPTPPLPPRPQISPNITIDEITLPMDITQTTKLYSLGTIVSDREGFQSERYIYPAGYKISRVGKSTTVPNETVVWISEIIDTGEDTPLFKVTSEDGKVSYEGATPTAPWSQILRENARINQLKGRALSVSGPEMYLFSNRTIISLINQLPGVENCEIYRNSNKKATPRRQNSEPKRPRNKPKPEKQEEAEKEKNDDDSPEVQEIPKKVAKPNNKKKAKKPKYSSSSSSEMETNTNDEDNDDDNSSDESSDFSYDGDYK